MPVRVMFRPLALSLLVLIPIPLLGLLCRGHTPSRLETANLPVWERQPPRPLPACRLFRLPPAPPGAVSFPSHPSLTALLQTDENRLLAGAEHSGTGNAGAAGVWLEAACVWGRSRPDLCAKQDRIATRLMTAQGDDGFLGIRSRHAAWAPRDTEAQAACLRGLLAYYDLTRRPAAIYAAMMAANRAMAEAEIPASGLPAPGTMIVPLTRLYQETGDARYLAFARKQEQSGGNGLEECALYEATGRPAYLQAARRQWANGQASPALAAELLMLTGRPGYAAALNHLPLTDPASARAICTLAPLGVAVNTPEDSEAVFDDVHLWQRTVAGNRTITVQMPRPTAFTLRVFLPPGPSAQVRVNGVWQRTGHPGRYTLLARRWRTGDAVEITRPIRTHPGASADPPETGR